MSGQLVQILGAVLILAGFVAGQLGVLRVDSRPYLWLNLAGATTLAVDAWMQAQPGFLLLEAVWAAVSAAGLVRRSRPAPP